MAEQAISTICAWEEHPDALYNKNLRRQVFMPRPIKVATPALVAVDGDRAVIKRKKQMLG